LVRKNFHSRGFTARGSASARPSESRVPSTPFLRSHLQSHDPIRLLQRVVTFPSSPRDTAARTSSALPVTPPPTLLSSLLYPRRHRVIFLCLFFVVGTQRGQGDRGATRGRRSKTGSRYWRARIRRPARARAAPTRGTKGGPTGARTGPGAYADAARRNDLRLLLSHTLDAPSRLPKSFVGAATVVLVLSHRISRPLQDFTTKSSPASSIATSSHDRSTGGWELAGTRGDSLDLCCPFLISNIRHSIFDLQVRAWLQSILFCMFSIAFEVCLLSSRFVCLSQFSFPT
jgi:hypothetical protein